MMWAMNAESLITIANKRLCKQASKETRDVVKAMCDAVIAVCPEFESELVPMCGRNGGVCHEIYSCRGEYD
jgi:thymidylate synthase ThyX